MKPAITGMAFPVQSYRCHYIARSQDTGKLEHHRWPVLGWAAVGTTLWPVRLEDRTGRGVLVGSQWDPDLDGFLGVLIAGAGLEELGEDVDSKARCLIRADMDARDDQ